jgi:hypothetical protein
MCDSSQLRHVAGTAAAQLLEMATGYYMHAYEASFSNNTTTETTNGSSSSNRSSSSSNNTEPPIPAALVLPLLHLLLQLVLLHPHHRTAMDCLQMSVFLVAHMNSQPAEAAQAAALTKFVEPLLCLLAPALAYAVKDRSMGDDAQKPAIVQHADLQGSLQQLSEGAAMQGMAELLTQLLVWVPGEAAAGSWQHLGVKNAIGTVKAYASKRIR